MNSEQECILIILNLISQLHTNNFKIQQLNLNILRNIRKKNLRILKLLLSRQNHLRITSPIDTIINNYVNSDFHSHFRMTRQTFLKLLEIFSKDCNLKKYYIGGNQPLSVEKKLNISMLLC